MPRRFLVIVAVFLAVALAAAIPARSAPSTQPASLFAFESLLGNMSTVLKFSPEQTEKVKVQADAMVAAIEAFDTAAIEKSRQAIAALASKTGEDAANARQQIIDDEKKALADYRQLVFTSMAKVNAELTPGQRAIWEGHQLNQILFSHYHAAGVTDDQMKQIKQAIDAAVPDLVKATTLATYDQATAKVIKKIVAEILSDEQVSRFLFAGPPPIFFPSIPGAAAPRANAGRAATRPARDPNLP